MRAAGLVALLSVLWPGLPVGARERLPGGLQLQVLTRVAEFDRALAARQVELARGLFCPEPFILLLAEGSGRGRSARGRLDLESFLEPGSLDLWSRYEFAGERIGRAGDTGRPVLTRSSETLVDAEGRAFAVFETFEFETSARGLCLARLVLFDRALSGP